jgi:predicted nucleotidyltransferase
MTYDKIKYYSYRGAQKEKLIGTLRLILKRDGRVVLALLFGSVTRRTRARDIDLAVYAVPSLSFNELLEVGTKIESELKAPVDLIQLGDVDPSFRLGILRRGVPVIANEQLRQRLLSEAFSELVDLRISDKLARTLSTRSP